MSDVQKEREMTEEKLVLTKKELIQTKKDIKLEFARYRAFLLRRISDYSKELEFWRNTIRKILHDNSIDTKNVNTIFHEISKSLNTLSTHGKTASQYQEIELLKDILSEIDEQTESSKKVSNEK